MKSMINKLAIVYAFIISFFIKCSISVVLTFLSANIHVTFFQTVANWCKIFVTIKNRQYITLLLVIVPIYHHLADCICAGYSTIVSRFVLFWQSRTLRAQMSWHNPETWFAKPDFSAIKVMSILLCCISSLWTCINQ